MKTARIMAVAVLMVGSALALHVAWLATYIVEKEKPLLVLVK
jgi:hypothetical protein